MNFICDFNFPKSFVKNDIKDIYERLQDEFSAYTGWMDLNFDEKIFDYAKEIRESSEALIVIGTGGSYLGAKAVIEALGSDREIYFLGNNLSSERIFEVLNAVSEKSVSVNVVSKSGNTLETMIVFQIVLQFMKDKYGEGFKERIYITTGDNNGVLKKFQRNGDYKFLLFPENIGGRFSVLSASGMLAIMVAGIDASEIIGGARNEKKLLESNFNQGNDAYRYATLRNYFYNQGYAIELFVSYEAKLQSFTMWLKQLFSESEGKSGKGLYPSYAFFPRDLHSLGQMIQEGKRNLFETVIYIKAREKDLLIPETGEIFGKFRNLSGKSLGEINDIIYRSVLKAHKESGIPNIVLELPRLDAFYLGELIYFFEISVAISSLLLNVNPFNQPGVEVYKEELGKSLWE